MNCKSIIQLVLLLILPLLAFCEEESNGDILVFVIEGAKSEDYASAIDTFKKYSVYILYLYYIYKSNLMNVKKL